ncbi:DUF3341 domain-containing protein [Luteolibacter arcticus]|uniref:DUF3341 domain-containing protein n=1 Tax=Luteolibacter arcticus TaxID=1581411 RepID=A0ABT3GQN1_9BACT|nr:DUF3341 domain-containing protein [Luteolibacter arcticus]MCW1925834.1 DUF3341 domain-containing protein [Luteolibacter arcticus]
MSHKSVYAIATSHSQAEQIVDNLSAAGFSANDISVLFPDKGTTHEFSHEKNTKAPEGAVTGAATGGVLGGTLGLLAGIGALAIPGVGPLIAAGPLLAALSGAAAGATVGGIAGGLIGLGIPEIEAKRYENRVSEGNILVSVHAVDGDEVDRAKEILKAAGAEDISSTSISDAKSTVS